MRGFTKIMHRLSIWKKYKSPKMGEVAASLPDNAVKKGDASRISDDFWPTGEMKMTHRKQPF